MRLIAILSRPFNIAVLVMIWIAMLVVGSLYAGPPETHHETFAAHGPANLRARVAAPPRSDIVYKGDDAALVAWIEERLSGRPAQFLDCADDGHPVRVPPGLRQHRVKPEKKEEEIAEVNPSGCCVVS